MERTVMWHVRKRKYNKRRRSRAHVRKEDDLKMFCLTACCCDSERQKVTVSDGLICPWVGNVDYAINSSISIVDQSGSSPHGKKI